MRKFMGKPAQSVSVLRALPLLIGLIVNPVHATTATPSPVMLANVYHSGVALNDYWVSEKYDGVRGYWDGEKLLTRSGTVIHPPAWFTAHWPKNADGWRALGRARSIRYGLGHHPPTASR